MKLPDKNGGFSASETGEKLLKLDGSEFNDDTELGTYLWKKSQMQPDLQLKSKSHIFS